MTPIDGVSYSLKRRLPCREPECNRDFSDPSTLSRHMKKRHQWSSKRGKFSHWMGFTSDFPTARKTIEAKTPVRATRTSTRGVKSKRSRREFHTSPIEYQEGFSYQRPPVDTSLFTIDPFPSLSPLSGPTITYQPDWQFPSSSFDYNSSRPVMNIPSCSTALLPELPFLESSSNPTMMPGDFQFGFGIPDSIEPAKQVVVLDQPFLVSSSGPLYPMAQNTDLPGSYGNVTHYDNDTGHGVDLFCEKSHDQGWQVAPNFGYCGPTSEYDSRVGQFNGFTSF